MDNHKYNTFGDRYVRTLLGQGADTGAFWMFAWESLPDGRNLHGWTENATKLWADKIKPYQALSVEELDALLRMQIPEGFTMPSTTALHMLAARLHKGEES